MVVYWKVKEDFEIYRMEAGHWELAAELYKGELLTRNEMERLCVPERRCKKVKVKKGKTYFSFGTRRADPEDIKEAEK